MEDRVKISHKITSGRQPTQEEIIAAAARKYPCPPITNLTRKN